MLEKIITDAATKVVKDVSLVTANGVIKTVTNALEELTEDPYERKMKRIRSEFPDAVLMKEVVDSKYRRHHHTTETIRKVSYEDRNRERRYSVVGRIETPIHVLRLHKKLQLIGIVTEIPQGKRGFYKSEIVYRGKHFATMSYTVYDGGIVRSFKFDDDRLKFRWLNKAETKGEVLYRDKVILRKSFREYIVTFPENEERCMLLAMAFLAAESPHGRDLMTIAPG